MQLGCQVIVGRKQAAAHAAQRNNTRAGKGCDVNHGARFETLSVSQGITQYQAPFSIGVKDLDGLATHAGHHVARFDGTAVGHVLAGRNQTYHVDGGFQTRQGAKHTQHAGRATHVKLHLVHFRRRLDGDAAGVKSNALAYQHHRRLRLGRAVIAQHDESQRLVGALGHCHERAHAKLAHLTGPQHLAFDLRQLCQRLGGLGQQHWCCMVGGPIGPLLGQFDALNGCNGAVKCGFEPVWRGHANGHVGDGTWLWFGLGGRVNIAGVGHGGYGGTDHGCIGR